MNRSRVVQIDGTVWIHNTQNNCGLESESFLLLQVLGGVSNRASFGSESCISRTQVPLGTALNADVDHRVGAGWSSNRRNQTSRCLCRYVLIVVKHAIFG